MASFHVRSISLPSTAHPLTASIEKHLQKLKASESPSPCHNLADLKNLYDCVDDFLQLPLKQQTLKDELRRESAEDILNGSLRLLDVCSTTRDVLLQTQECVKELQLSLRRRRGSESGLRTDVDAYLASRKNLNNVICKCLKNLKRKENCAASSLENNSDLANVLRGVEEISLPVFESILFSISQLKTATKPSGWSVVSKLLKSKRISCKVEVDSNEIEKIDTELLALKSRNDNNSVQVQNVLQGLAALESSIQEIEEEFECVYRRLVKARVSLLNVLNH